MKIYTTEELTKKLNKNKTKRKLLKLIIYPIIAIMLICNIILVTQKIVKKEKFVNLFGYKAFVVTSGSMTPTIEIGDLIITKEVKEEKISKGDIITFVEDNSLITHRIVDIIVEDNETYYQTKGDGNNANDKDFIKYEKIEGVFQFKVKKIGKIVTYFQSGTGVMIILVILYIIYKIIDRKDDRRMARHEKRKKFEEDNEK